MLSGSGFEVGTKESSEGRKRRSFARRPEVGSRVVVQWWMCGVAWRVGNLVTKAGREQQYAVVYVL